MKVCKEYLERKGLWPVREMEVPSTADPGHNHKVRLFKDGHFECECVAGSFKRNCRHVEVAKKKWFDTEGWRWKLLDKDS